MAKVVCKTVGCTASYASESWLAKHAKKPHTACSCGWAGMRFTQHLVHAKKKALDGRGDPGEGVHDEISMEYDAQEQRWLRVSTPGNYSHV